VATTNHVSRLLNHFLSGGSAAADRAPSRWVSAACFVLGAVSVGYAIHLRDGEYSPAALKWITFSLIFCVTGVVLPPLEQPRRWDAGRIVLTILALAVLSQFRQLLISPPSGWNWWSTDIRQPRAVDFRPFTAGVAAAMGLSALLLIDRRWVRNVCLTALFVTHFLLGVWMIRATPEPHIDVFVFQQQASDALLHGRNPYTITFRDIYAGTPQESDRQVYGQGLSEKGVLRFGFPYPPVSLYCAAIGYAVAGDHRCAQLAAMTLAGVLIAFCRPGRIAALAALLLLFTPRGFFILGRAWTEPFVVLMLAATVFCACRRSRALPLALGLMLATKQYLVFAVPLVALLSGTWEARRIARLLLPALLVALLVSAPLVLWDVKAFYHSAAEVQEKAPFRDDALSYLVWIDHLRGSPPGLALAFISMLAGMGLALWRCPRDASGFAAALAMTFLPFIAFNKQAFANYYYFVIGALCCAVAALPPGADFTPKSEAPSVR
jgi:hypothetical protein